MRILSLGYINIPWMCYSSVRSCTNVIHIYLLPHYYFLVIHHLPIKERDGDPVPDVVLTPEPRPDLQAWSGRSGKRSLKNKVGQNQPKNNRQMSLTHKITPDFPPTEFLYIVSCVFFSGNRWL